MREGGGGMGTCKVVMLLGRGLGEGRTGMRNTLEGSWRNYQLLA